MAVYRSDGVPLAGKIVDAPSDNEALRSERLARTRDIELREFRDGSTRVVSLKTIDRYQLKIMLTRDLEVMLVNWRVAAQLTTVTLSAFLVVLCLAVYLVQRANRKHAASQQALQLQMSRASKLESLGTLAGAVAHDFNNILAAIVGYGEMAQDLAVSGSKQARHLDRILQAGARGKRLVEQVLSFSRGGARTSIVFELEPVVQEVLNMLSISLRPGLVMEQELQGQLGRLRGDPTQAFAAVMNLCTNAMQAMPHGGMLTIELSRVQVNPPVSI